MELSKYIYFYLRLRVCITRKATASKYIFMFENCESRGHVILPNTRHFDGDFRSSQSRRSSILTEAPCTLSVKLSDFTL